MQVLSAAWLLGDDDAKNARLHLTVAQCALTRLSTQAASGGLSL